MGVLRFVRDVVCAPYSIPIGLINTRRPLSMCSETTKKELQWNNYEERIHRNMDKIFRLLECNNLKATFFVVAIPTSYLIGSVRPSLFLKEDTF